MDLQLQNKVTLVTGADRGTGKIIAQSFINEGAKVILHGQSQDSADSTAKELGAQWSIYGDLNSHDGTSEAIAQLAQLQLNVDILVNNYGSAKSGDWQQYDEQQWLAMYQTNVLQVTRFIDAVVPAMKQNKQGRIIQLGTIGSTSPNTIMPQYYAAKGALATLSQSLAKHLGGTGITVNLVSPGLISTPELIDFYSQRAQRKQWPQQSWEEIEARVIKESVPNLVGRMAKREEVADAVLFLASARAAYINGQNIKLDGGSLGIVS